jgi:hypothetical protein
MQSFKNYCLTLGVRVAVVAIIVMITFATAAQNPPAADATITMQEIENLSALAMSIDTNGLLKVLRRK